MPETPKVLFVDDNANLLSAVRRVVRNRVELITAESAAEALKALESEKNIAVVVSDQNMPAMKGVEFLAIVAKRWPMIVRIMQTGNDDQATATAAINTGQVFRFIRKPYDPPSLLETFEDALKLYETRVAERDLLETTLAGSVRLLTDLLAQTRPDLFLKAARVQTLAKAAKQVVKVPHAWELDLAAMLYPLGSIIIPEALAAKYALGTPLSADEQLLVDQSVAVAAELIEHIPRLGNIAHAIGLSRKGYDGHGFPAGGVKGADLPIISRLLRILVDIVDIATTKKISNAAAASELRTRSHLYDPEMLEQVIGLVQNKLARELSISKTEVEVATIRLVSGDEVVNDVHSKDGKLLLAAGAVLTDVTIRRLMHFAKLGEINSKMTVRRA